MIFIKNSQKKFKINIKKIKSDIRKILKYLNYPDFSIGIWFTTNKTIKKYNKKFRNKDKATDILSFPYHENLKPGQKITIKNIDDKYLGDIIISIEYASDYAKTINIPFYEHLQVLLVHGISHLLGYKHDTTKEFKKMLKFENKLLKIIKK